MATVGTAVAVSPGVAVPVGAVVGPADAVGDAVAPAVAVAAGVAVSVGAVVGVAVGSAVAVAVAVAVGVGIGVLGVTIATGFLDLSSTTSALAGMLGLAVGIDYALFIVNRHRANVRGGMDVRHSIVAAMDTSGRRNKGVLTADDMAALSREGFRVVFYDMTSL